MGFGLVFYLLIWFGLLLTNMMPQSCKRYFRKSFSAKWLANFTSWRQIATPQPWGFRAPVVSPLDSCSEHRDLTTRHSIFFNCDARLRPDPDRTIRWLANLLGVDHEGVCL